jgi:hypothetical protein
LPFSLPEETIIVQAGSNQNDLRKSMIQNCSPLHQKNRLLLDCGSDDVILPNATNRTTILDGHTNQMAWVVVVDQLLSS